MEVSEARDALWPSTSRPSRTWCTWCAVLWVQEGSQRSLDARAESELIPTKFDVEVLAFIAKIPVRRGQFPDRQANHTVTSMTPMPSISAEMTSPCRTGPTPAGVPV